MPPKPETVDRAGNSFHIVTWMILLLVVLVAGYGVSQSNQAREQLSAAVLAAIPDTVIITVVDTIFEAQPVRLIRIPPDSTRPAVVHDTAFVDRWHPAEIIRVVDTAWVPMYEPPLLMRDTTIIHLPRTFWDTDSFKPRIGNLVYAAVSFAGGLAAGLADNSCTATLTVR